MRKAVPVALVVVVLIIIGIVANASKHGSSAHSSTAPSPRAPAAAVAPPTATTETTIVTHTQPTGPRPTTPGVPKSGRCGDIAVNQHTSCAFAQVVVKDYESHPATTFLAQSPVTGLTYTMHCQRSRGVVACADNSTSTLAFNGPAPRS